MTPDDFRCYCGGICVTVERNFRWRVRYTRCLSCGSYSALDWRPGKVRWRNMRKAARMTRRYENEQND